MHRIVVRCCHRTSRRLIHVALRGLCHRYGNFNAHDDVAHSRVATFHLRRFVGEHCRFH